MKNRVLGAIAALFLAALGTALVMMYVGGAEERAFAGVETTPILVVTQPVPAGTPADVALRSAELQDLPARAVAADSISDGAAVAGLVTTADLVVGEQVLTTRFASSEEAAIDAVEVPPGEQEIAMSFDSERALGGQLTIGDNVGIFVAIGVGVALEGNVDTETEPFPSSAGLVVHKAIVTNIQSNVVPAAAEDAATPEGTEDASVEGESPVKETIPSGPLLITVAVTAAEAEKIVWGREFGTLWLSREPDDAVDEGTQEITRENILQ